MKRYKIALFTLLLTIFSISNVFATTYYVKSDGNDSLDGKSDDTAWKTIKKVNSFAFKVGDDVYFKCDDKWTEEKLVVDWSGTEDDYAVIGTYYGSGTKGVSGNKPIIDGNDTIPSEYQGLVWSLNQSYVQVENLNITNSEYDGVRIGYGNHVNVVNVDTDNSYNGGIVYVYSDYGEINGCVVDDANRRAIEAPGTDWSCNITVLQKCSYITVKNCTVKNGYGEGIGTGRLSEHIIIEYNTVYNNRRVAIYIDNGRYCTVRYNMVYGGGPLTTGASSGIGVEVEAWQSTVIGSDNYVYGNFIANCQNGIYLAAWHDDSSVKRYYVYNNTVVDCTKNGIVIWDGPYEDSEVKNNIFWCTSGDCTLATVPDTGGGVSFDYNLWSSAPDSDAIGAHDPSYAAPMLAKTSGWKEMNGSDLTVSMFALQEGSPAIDAGKYLGTDYGNLINAEKTSYPNTIELLKQDDYGTGSEIGADIFSGSFIPPLSKLTAPTALRIQTDQ
jgi:parallel beta-helix repeat protein